MSLFHVISSHLNTKTIQEPNEKSRKSFNASVFTQSLLKFERNGICHVSDYNYKFKLTFITEFCKKCSVLSSKNQKISIIGEKIFFAVFSERGTVCKSANTATE